MATVQKFEDLICWQKARELVNFIYDITEKGKLSGDFGLKNQLQRAAVSVMSNIAEGFDRGTREELVNFFFIAKGSCGEVKCQLYIAKDRGYTDISKFREGIKLCDEVSRLIYSFIKRVKTGSRRGMQFKYEVKKSAWEEFLKKETPETWKKVHGGED